MRIRKMEGYFLNCWEAQHPFALISRRDHRGDDHDVEIFEILRPSQSSCLNASDKSPIMVFKSQEPLNFIIKNMSVQTNAKFVEIYALDAGGSAFGEYIVTIKCTTPTNSVANRFEGRVSLESHNLKAIVVKFVSLKGDGNFHIDDVKFIVAPCAIDKSPTTEPQPSRVIESLLSIMGTDTSSNGDLIAKMRDVVQRQPPPVEPPTVDSDISSIHALSTSLDERFLRLEHSIEQMLSRELTPILRRLDTLEAVVTKLTDNLSSR